MAKEIIIQEEIKVNKDFIIKVIEHYKGMPNIRIGICSKILDNKQIVEEIINLSNVGKSILLMKYKFEKSMGKLPLRGSKRT